MRATVLLLVLAVPSAWAQRAGTTAPPAAHPPASQASQQASYLASRTAAQAAQSARTFQQMQVAAQNRRCSGCAVTPTFSVEAGTYASPVSVEITDATPGAVIYYTIDGKKPTRASTRYTGPVTISATTRLRAIAISAGGPSRVAGAVYEIQ